MAVTIRDVAKLAGVSPMTVSRVINGSPKVTAETRERVEAAIAELRYVPNTLARGLTQSRSGTSCSGPRPQWVGSQRPTPSSRARCSASL